MPAPPRAKPPGKAAPQPPRVPVRTRTEWGAKPGRGGYSPLGTPRGIVIHHTAQGYSAASKAGVDVSVGDNAVRKVQTSHFARGFSDVGYHFLIDGAGHVFQGRGYVKGGALGPGMTAPVLALGSHVLGHNTGQIGVNLLGCFGGGNERQCNDTPSDAAVDALVNLLTALCLAYGVKPAAIKGHRDFAPNVCPGDRLYKLLPSIRARVGAVVPS